jgi:hypothetical protein
MTKMKIRSALTALAAFAVVSTGSVAVAQSGRDPELTRAAISRFFGAKRENVMYSGATLADQLAKGINGPQSDYVRLPNGGLAIGACRASSCGEKAAVIIDPKGAVVGAALLGFQCTDDGCSNAPVAVAYIRKDLVNGYPRNLLRGWARSAFARSTNMDGTQSVAKELRVVPM